MKRTRREKRELSRDASKMTKMGYRRVSNSSCLVARVDRPDWQQVLHKHDNPFILMTDGAADYYRRAYSTDTLKLDKDTYMLIPGSNHDPIGFIDECGKEIRCEVVILAPHQCVVAKSRLKSNDKPQQTKDVPLTLIDKFFKFISS